MKKNYSLIAGYIGLFTMIYSGFCDALVVNGKNTMLYTVPGFQIIILSFIIYIYGLSTNKKPVYIISFIVNIIGYLYSLYLIVVTAFFAELLVENSDVAIYSARLGTGTYLYIISLIILIISIFLPKNNEKLKEEIKNNNTTENQLVKEIDINQNTNYLFCKYIYGCKELSSNTNGVIKINDNQTLSIIVINNDNATQEKIINYNEIKDLTFRSSIIFSQENEKTEDHSVANTVLATAILGGGLSSYAAASFMNQAESYSKIKEKIIYEINITLELGTILVQTKNNPKDFLLQIKPEKI